MDAICFVLNEKAVNLRVKRNAVRLSIFWGKTIKMSFSSIISSFNISISCNNSSFLTFLRRIQFSGSDPRSPDRQGLCEAGLCGDELQVRQWQDHQVLQIRQQPRSFRVQNWWRGQFKIIPGKRMGIHFLDFTETGYSCEKSFDLWNFIWKGRA